MPGLLPFPLGPPPKPDKINVYLVPGNPCTVIFSAVVTGNYPRKSIPSLEWQVVTGGQSGASLPESAWGQAVWDNQTRVRQVTPGTIIAARCRTVDSLGEVGEWVYSPVVTALDLPIASASSLGTIKVGSGLSITMDGTLSATGGGTVTTVVGPTGYLVWTLTGTTYTATFATQAANTFQAGPTTGSAAAPTFRAIVPADLPVATTLVFGAVKPDGTTITIAAGVISAVGGGSGTVTSVAITGPSILTWAGSPITTSGTLTATLANQNANLIFAGPASGSPAAPTFRAAVATDLAASPASSNVLTYNGSAMVWQAPSGGFTAPTDFITGLVPAFASTTSITVGTGTAYNPAATATQTVTSPITLSYSFTSQTDLTIDATNNQKVSSAAHPFTANDIGSTISVTSGTSWTVSLYIILFVDGSGNAFLHKSPSAAGNANKGTYLLELTASVLYGVFLSSATTVVIQGPLQFVDMKIDASNNKLVSSVSFTFTTAHVGQWISITAGTSWTAGYYQIQSVSGGKATLVTSPSAAGNANAATASMSMIPYSGAAGNYQGTASESLDGNAYRYLGAFLTTSANAITSWYRQASHILYGVNVAAAPFLLISAGTVTVSTSVSAAVLIPPTSRTVIANIRVVGTGTGISGACFGSTDTITPTASTGTLLLIPGTLETACTAPLHTNPQGAFLYITNPGPTGASTTVYAMGYLEDR